MENAFTILSRNYFNLYFYTWPNIPKKEDRIKKCSDIQGTQFFYFLNIYSSQTKYFLKCFIQNGVSYRYLSWQTSYPKKIFFFNNFSFTNLLQKQCLLIDENLGNAKSKKIKSFTHNLTIQRSLLFIFRCEASLSNFAYNYFGFILQKQDPNNILQLPFFFHLIQYEQCPCLYNFYNNIF